jgi:uncharacterized protein (DUF305 family)
MKMKLMVLAAASMYFMSTSCNNDSDTTTSTDTTVSRTDTMVTQPAPATDTATAGNGLMKAHESMMSKMQAMQMSGDFDVDFANMMIEHHQGAIDMSQAEVSSGTDEKMKAMAQKIITKQTEDQQKLRDFVKDYKTSGMKHGEGELQKSMSEMGSKMKSMTMSGNIDKAFATMMTSHHEDGIAMSKMEVKHGMSAKLKQMAQKTITDHQKEISEFKSWLSGQK